MRKKLIVDPDDFVEIEVPSFSDEDRAIRRSRRERRGELPTLEIGPSFEGPISGLRGVSLSSILPPPTCSAVQEWQEHWELHWSLERGWQSPEARIASQMAGESLYPALLEALWDDYILVPRFRVD